MHHVPSSLMVSTLLALLIAGAGPAAADTVVRVVVTNVVKQDGVLLAGAYSSPETWLGATPSSAGT